MAIEPEDVVWITLGVDVPFVLRKFDVDRYNLLGEAYVNGAMDGEMLQKPGVSA